MSSLASFLMVDGNTWSILPWEAGDDEKGGERKGKDVSTSCLRTPVHPPTGWTGHRENHVEGLAM